MRCGKQIALDRLEFRSTHISIAEGAGFNGANRAGRWPVPYDRGTDNGFIQQQSKGANSLRFVGDGTQSSLYQRGPGFDERATKNRSHPPTQMQLGAANPRPNWTRSCGSDEPEIVRAETAQIDPAGFGGEC
jgi:hypothetical protein